MAWILIKYRHKFTLRLIVQERKHGLENDLQSQYPARSISKYNRKYCGCIVTGFKYIGLSQQMNNSNDGGKVARNVSVMYVYVGANTFPYLFSISKILRWTGYVTELHPQWLNE
jgi:hypothetical protein